MTDTTAGLAGTADRVGGPAHDLLSERTAADPHPVLSRLRAADPVYWSAELNAWLVTRYDDIASALLAPGLDSSGFLGRIDALPEDQRRQLGPLRASTALWMGATSPADHVRMQRVLKRYFTPRTIAALRPRIQAIAVELVDALAGRREFEVLADLAYPLPARVIAELLGVPAADRDLLPRWSRAIAAIFQTPDLDRLLASQRGIVEMSEYLRGIVAERRREPRDDVISAMVAAQEQGAVASEEEILANCLLLLFAGHETTALVISRGLLLLLEHPDQLCWLRANLQGLPDAIEEMLRLAGPVMFTIRIPAGPVEVGGTTIPAGQPLYLVVGAGNRDPDRWTDPDRFDVTRPVWPNLAFGHGSFYCLGAALARVEAQVCFDTLFRRAGDLALHPDGPTWQPIPPLNRTLTRLPVTSSPVAG
jgi:cytochrome P450